MEDNSKEKGNKMKKVLLILSTLFIAGCNMDFSNILGEDWLSKTPIEEYEIDHIEIEVVSLDIVQETFQIWGWMTNIGDTTLTPRFRIEGSFYTDSSFTDLLGKDNMSQRFYDFPTGEKKFWCISYFPPESINPLDYPNFAVKDIKAIKEIYFGD